MSHITKKFNLLNFYKEALIIQQCALRSSIIVIQDYNVSYANIQTQTDCKAENKVCKNYVPLQEIKN